MTRAHRCFPGIMKGKAHWTALDQTGVINTKPTVDFKILVMFYLLSGASTASESPFSPRDLECVFFAHANVTCRWTPAVKAQPDSHYTLQVNLTGWNSFHCKSSKPYCSVNVSSLNRIYCIQVFAHSVHHPTVGSDTLCLNGTDAAKLPEPKTFRMSNENKLPRCLTLRWFPPENFPLSTHKIRSGYLLYQLQYSTTDQPVPLGMDVDLREEVQCVFTPCTQYSVRMRYRYKHTLSHWSEWSNPATGHTNAEAPSSVPQLWRRVQAADVAGLRHVTLLWKASLPMEAACTPAWFTVQCRLEGSQTAVNLGDCSDLTLANSSCHFTITSHTCICSLSMSNSAGSGPPTTITIPSQWQTDQTSLAKFQVTPLNNFSLLVQWEALDDPTITGFHVEWCIAAENSQCQNEPQWQRVDQNTNRTSITGLEPNICYSVIVRAIYGTISGPGLAVLAYSHQAAPSAGPLLLVAEEGCSQVLLRSLLPLEHRRGFITKYTLNYQGDDFSTRELLVSGNSEQFLLSGVSGLLRLQVKAHTEAGAGPAGPVLSLFIESCTSMQTALISGFVFIAGCLMLLCMCWRMRQRIRKNIWPKVPNPAESSLSDWL